MLSCSFGRRGARMKYIRWKSGNLRIGFSVILALTRFTAASSAATVSQALQVYAGNSGRMIVPSPNGARFALVSAEYVRIYDVATGEKLITLTGHASGVTSAAFSPDGTKILTGSQDKTAKLFFAATGVLIRSFSHSDYVNSVAFSPDGTRVLTGSSDKTAKLWEVNTGTLIRTFTGNSAEVRAVAFSPDGAQVLTGDGSIPYYHLENEIRLFDASTGSLIRTFSGHTDYITSLAFSPDGNKILSGSYDESAKIWDVASGTVLRTHTSNIPVTSVGFSSDGGDYFYLSYGVNVRSTETGTQVRYFSVPVSGYTAAAFVPYSQQVLAVYGDPRLLEIATGNIIRSYSEGGLSSSGAAAFSLDGTRIATSASKSIQIWDTATGAAVQTLPATSNTIFSVAFSPDGTKVLSGRGDYSSDYEDQADIWDLVTSTVIKSFRHNDIVTGVAYAPNGLYVVTGSRDRTVKYWHAESGAAIWTFVHNDDVLSVAISHDGKQIASGGEIYDGSARVWDISTGAQAQIFQGNLVRVTSLAFSPDDKQLLAGSDTLTASLYDIASGATVRTFTNPTGQSAKAVAFSPDGTKVLISASPSSSSYGFDHARILDAKTGTEIWDLQGHPAFSVLFTPDGKQALTVSYTVRLWDFLPPSADRIKAFLLHTELNPIGCDLTMDGAIDSADLLTRLESP